ncbi:protein-tyrosine phosphatase-like protein [Chaetomium tenue]|uniref:Protein-tyrosine phosphatase-like protein n=1 Tax=Chaetomium tenue TaxID=1854479 RepID=A0ACB7P104_9PEZI|nr:protein-tyrosine phosphatase-like protein [Chaetomium globosum]
MAHLPRFHRRKKDGAAPTVMTNDLPGKTTPPPGDLPPGSPKRSFQKLSPFRVFQRSSAKRARDSPPASLPHSPAAAPLPAGDYADGRPVSPMSLKTNPASDEVQKPINPPKMPAFLDLSREEIENKFSELVWRERNRLMQSVTNPSPNFRWARMAGPHLKILDRYLNIQPWQNNRVKLQVPEGHLDYINASPIVLDPSSCLTSDSRTSAGREPGRYIAMQGPKQTSTDHTWRMVVEQLESPGVIVMLTETHDGMLEKCFPYFPRSRDHPPIEVNEHDEFGDGFRATVRCEGMEETPAGDAIELRKLVIRVYSQPQQDAAVPTGTELPNPQTTEDADADTKMGSPSDAAARSPPPEDENDNDNEPGTKDPSPPLPPQDPTTTTTTTPPYYEKTVYHLLYKKWPDFGVPSLADLDSFFTLMRLSRELNHSPASPRIVHCSAGVGRSGTFIALEHLMRELDAGVLERYDERAVEAAAVPLAPSSEGGGGGGGGGGDSDQDSPGSGSRSGSESASGDSDQDSPGSGPRSGSNSPVLRLQGQGEDLIFETVNQLREQRRTMVQAEAQYLFLYQVLRQLWLEKYTPEMEEGGRRGDGEPAVKKLEVDPFAD